MEAVLEPPTKRKRRNKASAQYDWDTIRADYLAGSESTITVAARHGIPYPTLRDACKREKWAILRSQARARSTSTIAASTSVARSAASRAVADTIASAEVQSSLTAQRLIRESLDDSSDWLDHIRKTPKSSDAATIRAMVAAWSQVIGVGRQAHRLDDVAPVSVTIGMIVGPGPVERVVEIPKPVIDVDSLPDLPV